MKNQIQLTPRDMQIFEWLWKWKLGTTAALAARFFDHAKPSAAYVRLTALRGAGFIGFQPISDPHGFAWGLTDFGFRCVKQRLPELRANRFQSANPRHDLISTAVHFGDFLVRKPKEVTFFSEQELYCLDPEFYPPWVPQTEVHRPDGYWQVPINGKMVTVALEVELSPKKIIRYENLAAFYRDNQKVIRVIWIVPRKSTAERIQASLRNEVGQDCGIHNFAVLADFQKSGWQAPFVLGFEDGKEIRYLLNRRPLIGANVLKGGLNLNVRKCPFNTRPSKQQQSREPRYLLALQASPASDVASSLLPYEQPTLFSPSEVSSDGHYFVPTESGDF